MDWALAAAFGAPAHGYSRNRDLGRRAAAADRCRLHCGIYLSESGDRQQLEKLADPIFDVIGPQPIGKPAPVFDIEDVLAQL